MSHSAPSLHASAPLAREPLPPDLWIVVAAFNEGPRLGRVLDDLCRMVPNVVVVDDGSDDDTPAAVLARPAWLVEHRVNLGQGAALQTGISFALARGASHIVTFDADCQHRPDDIQRLLDALFRSGADYALGSRFLGKAEGMPLSRRIVLRLGVVFTRVFSGVFLTDTHNGLRAMTRRGAEHIQLEFNRMEHASEIIDQIARSGLHFVEVPVRIGYTPETLAKGQRTSAALKLGIRLLIDKVTR